MTYQINDIVLASDLNGFLTTTNNVYGTGTSDRGYGQTAILQAAVSVGSPILASHWTNLRNMIVLCANQQGSDVSSLAPSGEYIAGQAIYANEQASPSNNAYELANNVTLIDTNRLNVSGTSLSTVTNVWTVTKATTWSGSIIGEISVVWPNEDDARFYFNSGGQIRLHGSQPTGSGHPQDIVWNSSLTTKVGTVKFGVHHTTNTGSFSGSLSVGYYELTNSYQNVFNGILESGGSLYSADTITIEAKRLNYVGLHGGNGNGVQFRITFSDAGSFYYSAVNSAGTTFSFDNTKATTFLSGILSPTYATITPL
jgi:hypothetical protein